MDGKEQIIQKIIDVASEQAETVINNARSKADLQIKSANEQAEKIIAENKAATDESAENIIAKKATVAGIDSKKTALSAKQDLIDEVYTLALDKLKSLNKTDYLAYIEKRLVKYAGENDNVVLAENAPISESDVLSLAVSKKFNLTVSKNGKFVGGFILETPVCDKNMTFEATTAEYKTLTESSVAQKLFG